MTLGDRIKFRRETLHLTRDDLASSTGMSHTQIFRYEKGESQPTADVIVALATALNVTADWLLGLRDGVGFEGLNELEQQALSVFRSKPAERQPAIVEIMRLTN